jgi:transglutaminase-like putative cysteine protease
MQIRVGYELSFRFPQDTPMILALNVHYSRASDIVVPDHLRTRPAVPIRSFRDGFGNWCNRLLAPAGSFSATANGVVADSGMPDPSAPGAFEHSVDQLPVETLPYLMGSRYCETDRLMQTAWNQFSGAAMGWSRVQQICDFVHSHIAFGYEHADGTRTAWDAFQQRRGVCRDFAHLAVTLCRCMNIPARYCTGYLGDIGIQASPLPMDFSAWFEAYLGGAWHTFDARHNTPRIGRVLIARGRDAADVAIATSFGPHTLEAFRVWTDELTPETGAGP